MEPWRYRVDMWAVWEGPHAHIPADYKEEALRPLDELVRRTKVCRSGIRELAKQAHVWYSRNLRPLPGYRSVTLVAVCVTIYRQRLRVAKINVVTGKVLYIDRTVGV